MGNQLTRRTRALRFHSTSLHVIRRDGEVWLRGRQIDGALGYTKDHVSRLYERNSAEFTDRMTQLVDLPTAGGPQQVRLFSLRGAHLLGMFARTERAAEFRKWVLDVLDAQTAGPAALAPAAAPTLPPPPPRLPPPPAVALPEPEPTPEPSLKGRRWLVTIDAAGRETVEPLPAGASFEPWTWPDIANTLRYHPETVPRDQIMGLAEAATRAAFGAAASSHNGDGDKIAKAIHEAGDALALADLQAIAVAASMDLWRRVLAHTDGRAGTPGSRITRLVPVGPNVI